MLIDTHCHLYLEEFEKDIHEVVDNAQKKGVQHFFLPAINSETTDSMLQLEENFSDSCHAMMGLHPCYVKENYKDELSNVEAWLKKRKFAAIGECGLDFYWDKSFVKEQYIVLEKQIEWALEYQVPIILHTRNATQETIDVIKKYKTANLKGIFHCFGGSLEEAKQIIDLDFYLGIGGVVTYKNAGLDKVLKELDLKNIVLETDAPYLTPVPFRGKRNESMHLKIIAEKIAEIMNCSYEEVERATTNNAQNIFERYKILI
jgi:TatD DNase family protein